MKELGDYLKHTRISNGVSIAEAAEDLDFSSSQIENIESGNVRAFKDVYDLKEYIKQYAKYLGLDPDSVVDEFNEFLFERTSKISLDDIREAQKDLELEEKKAKSPYTMEYKRKIPVSYFVLGGICLLLLVLIVYIIVSSANKAPTQVKELMPKCGKECIYEFTY